MTRYTVEIVKREVATGSTVEHPTQPGDGRQSLEPSEKDQT